MEPSSTNKFFNFLEDTAVNMQTEDPSSETPATPISAAPPSVEESTSEPEDTVTEPATTPKENQPLSSESSFFKTEDLGSIKEDLPISEAPSITAPAEEEIEMLDDFSISDTSEDEDIIGKIKQVLGNKKYTISDQKLADKQIINIVIDI